MNNGNLLKLRYLVPTLLLLIFQTIASPAPVFAYGQWVDCVVVNSAGLSPYGYFGGLSYDIKVSNGCSNDVGSVSLDFDSGSFDAFSFNNRVTIYSLGSWGQTKNFSLDGVKPGYYFPSVKITASKDYSSKRVNLPSYTIEAPRQPSLGSNGGTAVLPATPNYSTAIQEVCVTGAEYGPDCYDFPSFAYEICSSLIKGFVQEKVGSKWINRWSFNGVKDSIACQSSGIPYLITINGNTQKTTKMRLSFTKTASRPGFYSYFELTVAEK